MSSFLFSSCFFISLVLSLPTAPQEELSLAERDLVSRAGTNAADIASQLNQVTATTRPSDIWAASATLSAIFNASPTPTNFYQPAAQIVAAGLCPNNFNTLSDYVQSTSTGAGSSNNVNTKEPRSPVYPTASNLDVSYDLSESALRGAIYIPSTFKYCAAGAPRPIILVPGTGETGYGTFVGSYIPLLQGSNIADPVWLNIPINLLSDAQDNAEYVAYAVNYISGISNNCNVSIAAWSQGNIDTQWAMKFWPSIRTKVTDHVAFSPDYHGTVLANLIAAPGEPLPPAVLQQTYNSRFITTLRAYNGNSAYVPTTTVYSGFFDEIVEPQQGTGASAYLLDARNVGVTNNEVQTVCAGRVAGTFYSHEGILYNPLGYALLVDALTHDGPGRTQRLDLGSVCSTYLTPGLDLADFSLTELGIVIAGFNILTYPYPVLVEPAIKSQYQRAPYG